MDIQDVYYLPPPQYLIRVFGSSAKFRQHMANHGVDICASAVTRWKNRKSVPQKYWKLILICAEEQGLSNVLSADNLLYGGSYVHSGY